MIDKYSVEGLEIQILTTETQNIASVSQRKKYGGGFYYSRTYDGIHHGQALSDFGRYAEKNKALSKNWDRLSKKVK